MTTRTLIAVLFTFCTCCPLWATEQPTTYKASYDVSGNTLNISAGQAGGAVDVYTWRTEGISVFGVKIVTRHTRIKQVELEVHDGVLDVTRIPEGSKLVVKAAPPLTSPDHGNEPTK